MSAEEQYAGRRLIIRSKKTQIRSYWPSVEYIAHEGARSFHSDVAALAFHGVASEAIIGASLRIRVQTAT